MEKIFVFLGTRDTETREQFIARYLSTHKEKIVSSKAEKYLANVCEQPDEALVKAGWGVFNIDDCKIEAFDEIWIENADELTALYADENIIYMYKTQENVVRYCETDFPHGEADFWLKRVTLIKRVPTMAQQDFFNYWQTVHGPMAAEHIIGAGIYVQNNVIEVPVGKEGDWDGVTEILYWNLEAFKYGHFSHSDSRTILKKDCDIFIGGGLTLLVREYVQK